MVLPRWVPSYRRMDVELLSSSTGLGEAAADLEKSVTSVGYSTFTRLWWELLPYIIVMKPMLSHEHGVTYAAGGGETKVPEEKKGWMEALASSMAFLYAERSFVTYKKNLLDYRESINSRDSLTILCDVMLFTQYYCKMSLYVQSFFQQS